MKYKMENKEKKELIQKIALGIIFYLILIAIFKNTIILKLNTETKKNQTIIRELQTEYQIKLINSVELVDMIDEIEKKEKITQEYRDEFIDEKDKKYIVEKLTQYGEKNNIKFRTMDFIEKENIKFNEFNIIMSVEADYENLLKYFESINSIKKKLIIKYCDIERKDNAINAKFQITGYIYKEVLEEETEVSEDE